MTTQNTAAVTGYGCSSSMPATIRITAAAHRAATSTTGGPFTRGRDDAASPPCAQMPTTITSELGAEKDGLTHRHRYDFSARLPCFAYQELEFLATAT